MAASLLPKTLVIGANGRIGQVLQACWKDQPIVWQSRHNTSAQYLVFDPLSDPDALNAAAANVTNILCLAGAIPGRNDRLDDNTRLAKAVVNTAANTGARCFLCSSAAVYGRAQGPLKELGWPKPENDYGKSKLKMERHAHDLAQTQGVKLTALRIGNIAGLDSILGGWKPGFMLDHFEDGTTPARSYIGVCTLAKVIGALLGADDLPEAVNVAQPGRIAFGDLLCVAGHDFTTRPAPKTAIPEVLFDVSLLQSLLPPDMELTAATPQQLVQEWESLSQ